MSHPSVASPPHPTPGDPDLIARVRDGDPLALADAYRRYAPGLLALVYRISGSVPDAEDVTQDLFVGLPEALRGYREQGRFEAWLHRVAVRLTFMRMRSARRRKEVALDGSALVAPVGRDPVGFDLRVQQALEELDGEQRAIVVLRLVEGYTHEEIAALLGIRRGAAQVRYHRALSRLRTRLEET